MYNTYVHVFTCRNEPLYSIQDVEFLDVTEYSVSWMTAA